MLQDLSLKGFIDELASNSPAPGGGSAAALSASLSSALTKMVFNLTIGKKFYDEYSDDEKKSIDEAVEKTNLSKDEFLQFIDKDANAFLEIMSAFKLPKSNDEEIKIRKQKIAEGYASALDVPLTVAKKAFKIYDYIYLASKLGNPNAASDAGVAALLLQAGIEGAVLNVRINLSSIKDEEFKKEVQKQCKVLVEEGRMKQAEIMKILDSKL